MPLLSQQFSDDQRLQACLVEDSAHVKKGDSGPYVLKIQQAVVILSGEAIPIEELDEKFYGSGTAAAVLAYKRKNNIINYSYQTQADDIVGKMTIKALDEGMLRFEAQVAFEPKPVPDPQIPNDNACARGFGPPAAGTVSEGGTTLSVGGSGDAWEPPVDGWPKDLKATLERSNALRTPSNDYLVPIIGKGQDRKTLKELSKLISISPLSSPIIREIHKRMKWFGIWHHVNAIRDVYTGWGSRGFKCDPVDHNAFLTDMKRLSKYRNIIEQQIKKARYCQDIGNVHGPRDTFREVVIFGPGLHVCITQPAARSTHPCDIHVDVFQQGNLVESGYCVPLPDVATAAHVISVSPWLYEQREEGKKYAKEKAKEYLKKVRAKVPGL